MSEPDFSSPRRQEALGVIILFGENLRKLIRIVAALVFASIYMDKLPLSTSAIIAVGAIVMAVFTLLQYLRFKFHIEGGELILEKGVLNRERLNIPLERIQTVHLSQNIIQQIVQLTGVRIDTAGSGGEELRISALTRTDALALQKALEKDKAGTQPIIADGDSSDILVEAEERKTLVHLTLSKLMLVGLTENHIRSGLVALGVVWGYFWQFEDMIKEYLGLQLEMDPDQIEQAVTMTTFGLSAVLMGIVIFLIASMVISLVKVVLRHFDLKASLGPKNLRVSSGLLKKNSYTIPLSKIQMLTWKGNFLRRIPGFESVSISQSRSNKENEKSKVEIPACYKEQINELEEALFEQEKKDEFFTFGPHGFYQIYLTVIFSLLGFIPAILIYLTGAVGGASVFILLYLLVIFLWVGRYCKTVRLTTNGKLVQFSAGWLFTNRTMLKAYKIQSVRFSQTIFQKRRGTAHLRLYTAGGSLTMRFMPEELVRELYNYLLYRVEVSEESWM